MFIERILRYAGIIYFDIYRFGRFGIEWPGEENSKIDNRGVAFVTFITSLVLLDISLIISKIIHKQIQPDKLYLILLVSVVYIVNNILIAKFFASTQRNVENARVHRKYYFSSIILFSLISFYLYTRK
jgi:hypothetical protein